MQILPMRREKPDVTVQQTTTREERLEAALRAIVAGKTPYANATVARLVRIAEEALRD